MTDKIIESLKKSSQKVAKEIAHKMKERKETEKELADQSNQLTMLEAKIEVHKEKKDALHGQLAEKKTVKKDLFRKRDALIQEKRSLHDQLYATEGGDQTLQTKLDAKSDQIGAVIEESKALSDEMQKIYEQTQEEQELISQLMDELHQLRYESGDRTKLLERKIADIDHELNDLRRKMKTISEKLE